ncbi:efflux transporter, RND family, MFP subunit [Alkaliphilus metalliredigens QYMF]|uniref:Efflux transporter, RND family, MFP subunit n=1 Tax=Alkaliphilus metalliredigens (strain QYMF) TaxID=293826 RepID=A6TJZ6_ALKMQ|nr:efflux RND transporter periplasmic adaptor subunit [Alkaliphilus metalliredigens]ABR46514.1 efflux transporter, RND family, MFP subunit [Alkaliphilus metalliredigens QYMF]
MKSYKKAILTIFLISTTFLYGCSQTAANEIEEVLKPVKVKVVETQEYSKDMEISGNVKPAQLIRSGFKVAGVIDHIHVEEGDIVKEGQTLMQLDPYDYQLGVNAARSQYQALQKQAESSINSGVNQAVAHLEFVNTQYDRMLKLYEEGAIPKKTLEEVETQIVVAQNKYQESLDASPIAEAQLDQARTGLEAAESKIGDTILKSPITGTVIKRTFEVGETVAPGHPTIILGRLDKLEVEIGVPDGLVDNIRIGKNVDVFIYGLDKEIKGTIASIDTTADLETRTFGVKVEIDNKENRIRPGMIAKVMMNTDKLTTIMIPTNAVMNDPDGAKIFVYQEEGYVVERRVILGEIFGDEIQVIEGLENGEKIVIEGHYRLIDGDNVKVEVVE